MHFDSPGEVRPQAPASVSGARRLLRKLSRNARAAHAVARTARCSDYPLLAHIVPTRRCNLACRYCNEYDRTSPPVPLARLERWLDKLHDLHTSFVTCSGGEPLLHPEIARIIDGIRERGMMAGIITNGYLLTPERIAALNHAGLDYLQISIDNIEPDGTSSKSLRLLDRRLRWLAEYAEFDININSVLGASSTRPADARAIAVRAKSLGFSASVGVIHDATGRLKPLGSPERAVWDEFNGGTRAWTQLLRNFYAGLTGFQRNLVDGKPNDWRCRSGARYLYIAEDGLVSFCSQQRGYPGIPIDQYGVEEIRRHFASVKPCAPYCSIGCSHRVAALDAGLDPFRKLKVGRWGDLRAEVDQVRHR